MLWTLVEKEIRVVLTSPKFVSTFVVCAVLILLSIGLGVREHNAFMRSQSAGEDLQQQELAEASSWSELRPRAFRRPDPLQIFVAGVHNDLGRYSQVGSTEEVTLRHSVYSDNPILALFRMIDLAFVVTYVLSLLALVFGHDAISGEREQGTLRLVLANPVPRARYVAGKLLGTWLGLTTPLSLLMLVGLLAVVLAGVPLAGYDWIRIGLFFLACTLYLSFFIALSLAVSALSRRSSSAFLILLAFWVVLVLVVPRASLTAATHLKPVPSIAEIAGRKAAFENSTWAAETKRMSETWQQRSALMEGMSEDQRSAFEDEHLWQWMEADDERRKTTEAEIAEHAKRLNEELRNRSAEQAALALALARLSPGATFQLVAMGLADSDYALKQRCEETMRSYQGDLTRFVTEKAGDTAHRRRIETRSAGSSSRLRISDDNDQPPVDLSEMPEYQRPRRQLATLVRPLIPDLGILALLGVLGFSVAVVGFLRSDVR